MKPKPHFRNGLLILTVFGSLALVGRVTAQDKPESSLPSDRVAAPASSANQPGVEFDALADKALLAMQQRAEALKIKGVAVVAYVPGNDVNSWISKMLVVGQLKSRSSTYTNDPGSNLLAIAYSKASEMADTLKPSGSGLRPPMKGEFGWQGGWIVQGKTGWLIAAFSGGKSAEDVQVSKTGLEIFSGAL